MSSNIFRPKAPEMLDELLRSVEWLRSGNGTVARGVDITSIPPRARTELSQAVTSFVRLRDGAVPEDDDVPSRLPMYGPSGARAEKLTSTRAALPDPREAASVDLMQLLPLEERNPFVEGNCLCDPQPSTESLGRLPVVCNVQEGEYVPLLRRMKAAGMIHMFPPGHGVAENGIFGLSKTLDTNSPQRLIWDGRRSNLCFNHELAAVVLPSPDMLGEVNIASLDPLFPSTSDVSQMYNRLLAPAWLWRYFGLPRVWGPSFDSSLRADYYFPALKVVPMGWSLAVRFAQSVHLEILRRAGVPEGALLLRGSYSSRPLSSSVLTLVPYIDDLVVLGTSVHQVNGRHRSIKEHMDVSGLPVHLLKDQPASAVRPLTVCLGLAVHQTGLVSPKPQSLHTLVNDNYVLLRRRRPTPREMPHLLERWVWPLLLRRPLLSAFSDCYRLASLPRPHVARPLLVPEIAELQVPLGLTPVIFRDLTRPVVHRLYATDSSPWGASVVYTDELVGSTPLLSLFRDARVVMGWYSFLDMDIDAPDDGDQRARLASEPDFEYDIHSKRLAAAWTEDHPVRTKWTSLQWKTAIIHRWRVSARAYHINVLEIEALILAVRHLGRSHVTRVSRVMVFLDSLVGLGALAKGRSPSRRLNRACRKLSAYALLANVERLLHWVPTEIQPTDAASRRYAPRNVYRRAD